ncbi:unnamed protein product [Debaryomyces tyrocola]|nr:unnamed protein product [Debaryomyces tyrocola]
MESHELRIREIRRFVNSSAQR